MMLMILCLVIKLFLCCSLTVIFSLFFILPFGFHAWDAPFLRDFKKKLGQKVPRTLELSQTIDVDPITFKGLVSTFELKIIINVNPSIQFSR